MKQEQQLHEDACRCSMTMTTQPKLYNREEEHAQLLDRFTAIVSGDAIQNELVLITGPSGNGKTVLAQSLRAPVEQRSGFFLTGKFDQLSSLQQQQVEESEQDHGNATAKPESSSFGAFVQAFTEYARCVAPLESERQELATSAAQAVGTEGRQLLTCMIPALKDFLAAGSETAILDNHNHNNHTEDDNNLDMPSGLEVQKRFQFVFKTFLGAICSIDHPLVLFLDDLQWANKESIDLLAAILTDADIEGLMILGACRGNEVGLHHDLSVMLRRLEDSYELDITEIRVQGLTLTAVQELILDTFQLVSANACEALAKVVHDHTQGNPFFTIQFLKSLSENGLLQRTPEGVVSVDYAALNAFFASTGKDIVRLLCGKILKLPTELQEVLQVAACLGASFDKAVMDRVILHEDASPYVESLQQKCFLVPADGSNNNSGLIATRYAFVHDRVQQAVYSLIDDKPAFHLFICRRLWNSYKEETSQQLLDNSPLVVNQLQLGVHLITDEQERISAARLCLHAGKLVMRASSFRTAASYFETGIVLLGRNPWQPRDDENDHDDGSLYKLTLNLFTQAAEVEYAIGNLPACNELVNQVLEHARSMEGKIQAYSTRIYSLGSQHRLQDAIDVSAGVLRQLGEPLPSNGGLSHVVWEFLRTTAMLQGMTDDKILALKRMDNAEKSAAMSILNVVFIYFFISKPLLAPLLAMRMVQITLRYGLSGMSGFGFTSYALLLCSLGKIDEGRRFADLGMELQKQYGGREWSCRVLLMAHLFTYPSKWPVRESIDPLLSAFRIGMSTGDTEFAMFGAQFSCHCAMYSSRPLGKVFHDMKIYRETFWAYKQHLVLAYHEVLMQLVANLLGESNNPSVLDGEFINFEKALRFAKSEGHQSLQYELYGLNLIVAYLCRDWERCRLMSKGLRKLDEKVVMVMAVRLANFFDAMAALSRAEHCKGIRQRQKLLNRARWILMRFQRQAKVCPENCSKNAVLLEAEFDIVAKGKLESGIRKYERAIELAKKEDAFMEQAIAAERAAMALRNKGRHTEARPFLESALASYTKWGAKIKVDELVAMLESNTGTKTSSQTSTETEAAIHTINSR